MIVGTIIAGIAVITGTIVLMLLALDIRDAERRCADARVDAQLRAGQLSIALANADMEKARGDNEKRRADALDDVLAEMSALPSGPVDGAYERLLQKWRSARKDSDTADGTGSEPVSSLSTATTSGSLDVPEGPITSIRSAGVDP